MRTSRKLYNTEVYEGCFDVVIEEYIHSPSKELSSKPRPAMLVLPGGGYNYVSDREGEPIAAAYFSEGYNCFVLRYTTANKTKPINYKPLCDAAESIAQIRENSIKYYIDPERICVIGFSAGGHLAAHLSTSWHLPILKSTLKRESSCFKPNACILCYPVISGLINPHQPSFNNLLGDNRTPEETRELSAEHLVSDKTPPCFIWHTFVDSVVPVENSLIFAKALSKAGVSCELHIFPEGNHGLSRCNRETAPDWDKGDYVNPYVGRWLDWSFRWLDYILYSEKTAN